ncbi:TetR/AcrR family transcriptional regulator [Marinisporobacter balticus]|uniref:TetR family transcriptional regulator n=1 Tax=Marinisporobacter balticus TaxID=2018667 RepID=A0A4R2KT30_9FIRM|nr:TetR/AcrR family transcriptional regulator [Marinisporobacter balticus]TCO76933.1 TetR family transcriptional regulator [Marinisporobacter balticus]
MIEDGNITKKKILETALRLFSKNGFSATSVRQICREAGFRESVIYNHFASKYDILRIIFLIEVDSVRNEFFREVDIEMMQKNPKDVLYLIADRIMIYANDENRARFLRVIMMEMFRDSRAKKLIKEDVFENGKVMLKEIFLQMMKAGIIKEKDPQILANEFLGPLIFFNLEHLLRNSSNENITFRHNLIQEHIDFFWEKIKTN